MIPEYAKILGLFSVTNSFGRSRPVNQFFYGITAIIALTAVTGIMVSALLMGICYFLYASWLRFGFDDWQSLLLTLGCMGVITAGLIVSTLRMVRHVFLLSHDILRPESSLITYARGIRDAFLEGLLSPNVRGVKQKPKSIVSLYHKP